MARGGVGRGEGGEGVGSCDPGHPQHRDFMRSEYISTHASWCTTYVLLSMSSVPCSAPLHPLTHPPNPPSLPSFCANAERTYHRFARAVAPHAHCTQRFNPLLPHSSTRPTNPPSLPSFCVDAERTYIDSRELSHHMRPVLEQYSRKHKHNVDTHTDHLVVSGSNDLNLTTNSNGRALPDGVWKGSKQLQCAQTQR